MKFSLSESRSTTFQPKLRSIEGSAFSQILTNLLTANSESDYKLASKEIRGFVRPTDDNEEYFGCINPDWFDDNLNKKIDHTTCAFCGYRGNCTINIEYGDYIEVLQIGDVRVPSRKFLRDNVLFPKISTSIGNTDPFFGFSLRAGHTRKLYIISQKEFDKVFPNSYCNKLNYDAAVGYDLTTGMAIWPIDQQFLEVYEGIKHDIQYVIEKEMESNPSREFELTSQDMKCMIKVALDNNWIESNQQKQVIGELKLLCQRLMGVLKSDKIISKIKRLVNTQMTPELDIPYTVSGSGLINLTLRWIQLKPQDILYYLDLQDKKSNHYQALSRINLQTAANVSQSNVSIFPRFPAIAISPISELNQIKLEQNACKIIDVVVHEGTERMLLLDSLGIDLLEVL